jgi:hypothetical protein
MNRRSLAALTALNLALFAGLLAVTLSPTPAAAQFVPRGDYAIISGATPGRNTQKVVYVVDVKNARMIALIFRSSDNTFELVGSRDIGTDAAGAGGRTR